MTETTSTSESRTDVAAYAAAVRAALRDLPGDDALALLEGLDEHLIEVRAEGPLELLLGPPERYAAELRQPLDRTVDERDVKRTSPSVSVDEPARAERRPIATYAVVTALAVIAVVVAASVIAVNDAHQSDLIVVAAAVGLVLIALQWLVRRFLPAKIVTRVTVALVGVALLAAVRLGVGAADTSHYIDSGEFSAVTTAVSAYPVIPDFRGMSIGDATGLADQLGLTWTIRTTNGAPGEADGLVLEQEPVAGSQVVDMGSPIVLTVSGHVVDQSSSVTTATSQPLPPSTTAGAPVTLPAVPAP